jgi:hypothetical protein
VAERSCLAIFIISLVGGTKVQFGGTLPQLAAFVSVPPQIPQASIPAVQRSVGVGVADGNGEIQISGV